MQRWVVGNVILFSFLCPQFGQAAVTITEVAWMGEEGASTKEWLELYNDGDQTVSLEGWKIGFIKTGQDDETISVGAKSLKGEISGGQYLVLKRTDDYTGAMVDTGATVVMFDAEDNEVDRVVGGKDWCLIGGDNKAKTTAQRTSTSWMTAVATPGQANINPDLGPPSQCVPKESGAGGNSGSKTTTTIKPAELVKKIIPNVTLPANELSLEIVVSEAAYVGQTITLRREIGGMPNTILQSMRYTWNFGDGFAVLDGLEKVTHTFTEPGKYIVTLRAKYADYEAAARHEILVLPVKLSWQLQVDGRLTIFNDTAYEVDISNYQIVTPRKVFTFPRDTIMTAHGSITLPAVILGLSNRDAIWLRDNTGKQITATAKETNPAALVASVAKAPVGSVSNQAASPMADGKRFSFAGDEEVVPVKLETVGQEEIWLQAEDLERDEEEIARRDTAWSYWALGGLLVLVIGGIFVVSRKENDDREVLESDVYKDDTKSFFAD